MRYPRRLFSALLVVSLGCGVVPLLSVVADGSDSVIEPGAEVTLLAQQNKELKSELRKQKARVLKQKARTDGWRLKYLSKKRVWSRADVRWVTRRALKHYKVPRSEWSWVLDANQAVIYGTGKGTPRESSGDTKARNGRWLGLHQWNGSWSGTARDKTSGKWSCYRFVRCYRDGRTENGGGAAGGKKELRQHWWATLGPYRYR